MSNLWASRVLLVKDLAESVVLDRCRGRCHTGKKSGYVIGGSDVEIIRSRLHSAGGPLAGLVQLSPVPVVAQEKYPSRIIRMLVPFPAGGATDPIARFVADRLSKNLGQSVVIENRVGAGGSVGAGVVAKSPPDGYTLLATPASYAINPTLYAKVPYDIETELTPVALVNRTPMVFMVPPELGPKTMSELTALAKDKPKVLNYGIAGNGGVDHLINHYFNSRAGIDIVKVPYGGVPAGITALLRGEASMMVIAANAALPYIQGKQLLPLAVTSADRVAAIPDVPTMKEAGFDDFAIYGWVLILAPSATPPDILNLLHTELYKVLAEKDVRDFIAGFGGDTPSLTLPQLKEWVLAQHARLGALVKATGARVE